MTTKEQRELDAWIAENVMGLKVKWQKTFLQIDPWIIHPIKNGYTQEICRQYTLDPAAAMEVLKKCVLRLGDTKFTIEFAASLWFVESYDSLNDSVEKTARAKTLELAICLFAKKLFTKGTK